jgi:hypothetical protein
VGPGRERLKEVQLSDQGFSLGPLDGEETVIRPHVNDLDIFRDDVVFQPLHESWGEPRFEIQEHFVRQLVNVGVGDETPFRAAKGGVTAPSHREGLDVVGYLTIQEADPVRPGETDSTAKAQVNDACGRSQGLVFCVPVSVVGNGFVPIYLAKMGVPGGMNLVQVKRQHCREG